MEPGQCSREGASEGRTRHRPESVAMELRSGNEGSQSHLQRWESRDATNCQVSLWTMVSESSSGISQLDPQGAKVLRMNTPLVWGSVQTSAESTWERQGQTVVLVVYL